LTYNKVKDIVNVNELGSVTVKGKQHPVVIYDLVGVKDDTRRQISSTN
jgi:class 3 adenylate cyclase